MSEPVHIVVVRDIHTGLGTIAPGTPMPAIPSIDGGWQLELSLPLFGVPSHPVSVDVTKIREGRTLLNSLHAQHDYRFARSVLGLGHGRALAWIQSGYRATERQMFRWGLTQRAMEAA